MNLLQSLRRWFEEHDQVTSLRGWQNERESPRYNVTFFARYGGDGPLIERRGNVSIGGFCFEGERELSEGSEVTVQFKLPGDPRWIKSRGRVLGHVHHQGWLGIRGVFTGLDFQDERRLARWMDSTTREIVEFQTQRQTLLPASY